MVNDKKREIEDRLANFYDQNCQKFSQTRNYWWSDLNFIRKYLKKKGKILDFGCGNGRLLEFLRKEKSDLEYQGVDISQGLIEIAREKYPNQKFIILQNQEKLPFKDLSFDLIIAIAVFHHFSPEMAEKTFQELYRILKKEGKIILTVWYLWSWKYLPFLWQNLFSKKVLLSGEISFGNNKKNTRWCYWWTLGKIKRVLEKSGFVVLKSGVTLSKTNQKRNYWVVGTRSV